jgi:hypothetical protein
MGCTACTEPQCVYKGAFYLTFLHEKCVRARACVCVCACACVRVRVRVRACVCLITLKTNKEILVSCEIFKFQAVKLTWN